MSYFNRQPARQMTTVERLLAREAEEERQREGRNAFLQRQARRDQRARYERNRPNKYVAPTHVSKNNYHRPSGSWVTERDRQRKAQPKPPHRKPQVVKPNSTETSIAQNAFAMLDSESESDEEQPTPGPTLPSQKSAKSYIDSANTWAAFRVKPPTKPTVLKKRTHDSSTTDPVTANWDESDDEDEPSLTFDSRWDSD